MSVDEDFKLRKDGLDPLPYAAEWPSLRSATGRVDIHSLAAFFVKETNVRGDYFEFGVGRGRSTVAAARAEQMYPRQGSQFQLFDTFAGLPEVVGRDTAFGQFNRGDFAFSQESVVDFLEQHGVQDLDRFQFWPGDYETSLLEHPLSTGERKAAIVHIDCDLYESARLALMFVRPFLSFGTVMIFDDWNCYGASPLHGERAAVREVFGPNSEFRFEPYAMYGWHGAMFIVTQNSH